MTSFSDVPLPLFGEDMLVNVVNVDDIDVKILTVKQPWATALVSGGKDVENRTWDTSYRGWILVHAGKSVDEFVPVRYGLGNREEVMALPRGCVIGAMNITSVVRGRRSPWAKLGCWHWCHDPASAVALPVPVPWRGLQRLTRAPVELLHRLPASFVERIR